jgi:hypothetical protein
LANKLNEMANEIDKLIEMQLENVTKFGQFRDSQETLRNSLADVPERLSVLEDKINTGVQTDP